MRGCRFGGFLRYLRSRCSSFSSLVSGLLRYGLVSSTTVPLLPGPRSPCPNLLDRCPNLGMKVGHPALGPGWVSRGVCWVHLVLLLVVVVVLGVVFGGARPNFPILLGRLVHGTVGPCRCPPTWTWSRGVLGFLFLFFPIPTAVLCRKSTEVDCVAFCHRGGDNYNRRSHNLRPRNRGCS